MIVDEYRSAFAEAFEAYVQEGSRMKDLLLSQDNGAEQRDVQSISQQQMRLNDARRRYEEARTRYVENVLKDFVTPAEAV